MESINLIEDIQKTIVMEGGAKDLVKADIFTDNASGESYARYLELLDTYCKQSVKGKFTNNYEFFVDDEGNYVKNALDKKDEKNNMVILKPKYINIKKRLIELNEIIKQHEYLLRVYRTELLNNNNTVKGDFDSTLEKYNKLLEERDTINDYNNKINNIGENKDIIDKLKLDNINLNLEQYTMMDTIKLREAEIINKYLLNNEAINNNYEKISSLKSQPVTEFIVKEVFNNKIPVKKTIKFKRTKKSSKPKADKADKAEAKDEAKDEAEAEAEAEAKDESSKPKAEAEAESSKAEAEDESAKPKVSKDESSKAEEEVVDSSKKSKSKEEIPDPEKDDELEEVDLGLKAEALDLGDDLEALQPMFDEGDEENQEYVFNKTGPSKDAEEDKNIPLKLGSDSEDEETDTTSNKEGKGKDKKVDATATATATAATVTVNKGKAAASDTTDSKEGKEGKGDEIDLEKLSKQLNKKVKDPKIKIIKIDPNLQFSNISSAKCDDSKTKRSDIETTNVAGGKKRRKKGIDPDLKNCMFPFKEGKGKKAVMKNECSESGIEDWCATERKEDCSAEKWAYCKSEK